MTSNVAATSTTGLYGISSNVRVPNSAQQLLNLLYSNGNVNFSLATGNTQVQANAMVSGGGGGSSSVQLTGNVNGTGVTGSPINTTIAATGVTPGNYGSSSLIPTVVVGADGRVLSITTNAVSGGGSSTYGNSNVATFLANFGSNAISTTGNITGGYFVGNAAALDRTTGAAAGTYGSDTVIPTIIVDAKGRITSITTNAVSGGGSYGNSNVAAYLASNTDATISTLNANAAVQAVQIDTLTANAATQATAINTVNANLGAFQTYANATFGTSNYGNANVAAYLPTDPTITGIQANIGAYQTYANANAATQATSINTINANLGAYQTFANVNFASAACVAVISTQLNNLDANVGAYEIYANVTFSTQANAASQQTQINTIDANLGTATTNITTLFGNAATQATAIDTINANLGAFETYANVTFSTTANSASQQTQIDNINANLGGFETYANVTFSTVANAASQQTQINTNTAGLATLDANVGAFETYANVTFSTVANAASQQTQIDNNTTGLATLNANVGAFETYANVSFSTVANAASQQTQIDTNTSGLATLNANVGAFETYANVTFQTTASAYGNANVAAYLPTYPGSLDNSSTIQTINANLGTATNNITTLFSNAATQSTDIAGIVNGTTTLANVKSTGGYFWANGTPYNPGGTYGNTQVAAFLPTYTGDLGGNLRSGNVNSTSLVTIQSAAGQGVFMSSGTGANIFVSADSYIDLSGTSGIVINSTPQVNITDGNLNVYKNTGTNANGYIYADNNIRAGGNVIAPNFTFANGVNILSTVASSYGNTQVAAYLDGSTTTVRNAAGILSLGGNTASLLLSPTAVGGVGGPVVYAANSSNIAAQGGVYSTTGYFWANGTAYATTSTYGNTQVAAFLPTYSGSLNSLANVQSVAGYFWANGTAYSTGTSFTGNLAGSVLYDGINERIIANAFPLSTESTSIPGNATSKFIVNEPNYITGVLQQPPLANATPGGTGIVSTSSQTIGMVQSANIGFQSGYGFGSQNRDTINFVSTIGVTPVTANTMANQDRIRAGTFNVDLNLAGQTYGLMTSTSQNASPMAGVGGVVSINGYGNISAVTGGNYGTFITPAANQTANIQYTAGIQAFTNLLNTAGTTGKANVVYNRGIVPFITGFSSNLTVQYAVGMHTYSGWAGTGVVGAANNPILGRFAVLNEDANTTIQTNGNLIVTGNTSLGPIKETQFSQGNQTGTVTVNYFSGTVQTATLTGNITINTNNVTNMPTGGTVTLILTQDGTGSRTLTSNIKFAGGSKTLSTAAGAIDTVSIYNDGTNLLAALVKGYS